jgi:hypothetical protein
LAEHLEEQLGAGLGQWHEAEILKDSATKLNGADAPVIEANNKSLESAVMQRANAAESFAKAEEQMDKQEKEAVDNIVKQLEIKTEGQPVAGLAPTWSRQMIINV